MTADLADLADLERAAALVHEVVPATPQIRWPLLCDALGTDVWVKHENHGPVGAFKLRGGLVYVDRLLRRTNVTGLISATRGNHGQSIAFAGAQHGLPVTVVVPMGNSREKNAAMRALGASLVEHGEDFQSAREHAQVLADRDGLHMVPSFHADLVDGVSSYALELFGTIADLDVVYVPVGMGSGVCAVLQVRDALGLDTRVVAVVSAGAPAYALSVAAGAPVEHPVTTLLADGMACRSPDAAAVELIRTGCDHLVTVTDDEVGAAMKSLYVATHNVAEGAGAAAWAAAWQERDELVGQRVAVVMTGGNVDSDVFATQLQR
jgi:threonine dehydratase